MAFEPVLSIEEMAKESPVTVPENFIRPDQGPGALFNGCSLPTIPTIDMKRLVLGETTNAERDILHSACKEWGIFQLVNHGISSSLLNELHQEMKEFFSLPLEEKVKYKVRPGDVEGYGQVVRSKSQKFDWHDRFYVTTNPIHKRKSYLFPELPSSLREILESYIYELQKLAMELLGFLGSALNMEVKEIKELFEDGLQTLRLNNYPPCPQPELVTGLVPHSDATAITILHQANSVDGLQIKRDGVWIPVNIAPDSFVVNVGDIMEMMSNGFFKSIEHRVTVNAEKIRMTIAVFFNPKLEAEIGPLPAITSSENPPLFRRIRMDEFVKDFFSRNLNGKTQLEAMRIQQYEEPNAAGNKNVKA